LLEYQDFLQHCLFLRFQQNYFQIGIQQNFRSLSKIFFLCNRKIPFIAAIAKEQWYICLAIRNVKTGFINYVGARSIEQAVHSDVQTLIVDAAYHEQTSAQPGWIFSCRKRARTRHGNVPDGTRGCTSNSGCGPASEVSFGTPNMVQVSRPKAITRSAYLADSYSGHVRRDEKRFLPKSILRQNGASYPLGGEEEKKERKGIRDGRPSSLLNTCLRNHAPPQTNGLMTCQVIF